MAEKSRQMIIDNINSERSPTAVPPSQPYVPEPNPAPRGYMVPFRALPEGYGSPAQRVRFEELCVGKRFAVGSGGGRGCTQTYQFLMGQIKLPNAVAGGAMNQPSTAHGSYASPPVLNTGHVTTSAARPSGSSRNGGSATPINPITHEECVTMIGQTTKTYGSSTFYLLNFSNSCDITATIRGITNEGKEKSNGILKNSVSSVTCGSPEGCSGFAKGYVIY